MEGVVRRAEALLASVLVSVVGKGTTLIGRVVGKGTTLITGPDPPHYHLALAGLAR